MSEAPRLPYHPVVQLLRWIRDPFTFLDQGHARCGDTFRLVLPGTIGEITLFADPEMVKQLFALDGATAHAGKANVILKPFFGTQSILLLDGSEHVRHRKMMTPGFHGERMHAYGHSMLELAHEAIDAFPVGTPFPVHRSFQSVTLRVILRTVFGLESGPRFRALEDTLSRALDVAANPSLLFPFMQVDLGRISPWGQFRRLSAQATAMMRSEIELAREKGTAGRTDVLASLVEARDEHGGALSVDEIEDELRTLLVAGHETTATALAWTLRWLLTDAPLVERLRAELATAGGDPRAIAKLELLDATIKESLRLQPVVPLVMRVLQSATRIGPYEFGPGTVVAASIYLVHRRPSLYPEPQRFRPERFLSFRPAPWEWVPFGGGLRRCIGAAFALYEMKMVLAALLPRVDARLATPSVARTRRSITISPRGGLPVIVTARRPRPPEPLARVA